MSIIFYQYPPCSTCRKAKKFLLQHEITFVDRHIVEETPSFKELEEWVHKFDFDITKLFNTSGNVYKELKLKDQMGRLSEKQMLELLSSNGMLLKRPLLILEDSMLVGFHEQDYEKALVK